MLGRCFQYKVSLFNFLRLDQPETKLGEVDHWRKHAKLFIFTLSKLYFFAVAQISKIDTDPGTSTLNNSWNNSSIIHWAMYTILTYTVAIC